jgi:TonB family protein
MHRLFLLVSMSLLSTFSYAKVPGLAAAERAMPTPPPPVYVEAAVENPECLKIDFPSIALQAPPEGITTLSILISPQGEIIGGDVSKSSGSLALDNAAVAGLKNCRFKAATDANQPQYSWTIFQYVWKHDAAGQTTPLVPLPEGMNKPPVYNIGPFYNGSSSTLPDGAVT